MSSYTMIMYFGDKGRYPSRYRQGTKIQKFSIKGRANDEERTTLWGCMIGKESATPMRIKLPT